MSTSTQVQTRSINTVTKPDLPKPIQLTIEEDEEQSHTASPSLADLIPLPPPSINPTEILSLDKNTPDEHVPRDPRLLRLTGAHPFNCEPQLTELYKQGFLTPPELHYVRNHGPVPRVLDEEIPNWEISIEGLVENPMVLNFRQILQDFEQITTPVTLVCAGNRRKEQNQVRKTKGFSWGSAGISTSLFTGPMMVDILRRAKPLRRGKYLCMEGADKLPNGNYETSVKLNWAMDFNRGIMLAHKMNGEPLRPDHGRPIRTVVPGVIGGRSVKWLKRLIVTEAPSRNWYHIYDNRVLPNMVTPEMSSNEPKWWQDDRYAIYDLNVNSSVVFPENNEELTLSSASPTYSVKGYSYSGGGRRITRVEISLDKGKSWRLADIDYAEDKYRDFEGDLFGGKVDMYSRETCFCWCFWSLNIAVSEMEHSDAILVRAMDEALAIQPRDMYWSVLGMMNNPWFRVTITREDGKLKFEHPTHPTKPGGWMERVKKAGGDLTNGYWGDTLHSDAPVPAEPVQEINMKKEGLNRVIDTHEFKDNVRGGKPWFVINGEVYDGTTYLNEHPGGAQSIISAAGTDASDDFLGIHSETAKAMMPTYHIGTLSKAAQEMLKNSALENPEGTLSGPRETFLHPRYWIKVKLMRKKHVSWDSRIFTFELEHPEQTLGLPVGQHLMLRLPDPSSTTGASIIRSYTPVSEKSQRGSVDILIKIYFNTPERPGGKMTTIIDQLPLMSTVECKGPTGRFEYLGNGDVKIGGKERRHVRSFRMICGGSGITPLYQILRDVMQDPNDATPCVMLNGNKTEEDILCRDELDTLAALDNERCKIVHVLSRAASSWTGLRGYVGEELLREYAMPDKESMVLLCGPPAMMSSASKLLFNLGWAESDLHFF